MREISMANKVQNNNDSPHGINKSKLKDGGIWLVVSIDM